jgi:hypothetical protein
MCLTAHVPLYNHQSASHVPLYNHQSASHVSLYNRQSASHVSLYNHHSASHVSLYNQSLYNNHGGADSDWRGARGKAAIGACKPAEIDHPPSGSSLIRVAPSDSSLNKSHPSGARSSRPRVVRCPAGYAPNAPSFRSRYAARRRLHAGACDSHSCF